MTVKAVVFDLFKTLGEFERVITDEEASALLLSRGYPVYPQAWRHAFSFTVFIDYPRHGYGSHEALLRRVFHHLEADVEDDVVVEVANLFRGSPFRLYSESIEAVERVKGIGLKAAIATSTPRPFFIEGVEPIAAHIDFICTGYEAGHEKSNPHIYQVIMNTLKTQPFETVVIGDDPMLDIANSKKQGMKAIHVMREGSPSELADGAAEDVLEAVRLLESWV